MANLQFTARTPTEVPCLLSPAGSKTILQIQAPANQRVKILGWEVAFDGTSITAAPLACYLLYQDDAGTMASGATGAKRKGRGEVEVVQTVVRFNASTEPTYATADDAIDQVNVHPQSGYSVRFPYGQEIILSGGEYLGIVVSAEAAVNCLAKIFCEE